MGELSCNEVLTSFGLVPDDALEGDRGAGLAGPQTLRLRDGPHAGPNAHVGHVLQHKVRTVSRDVSHIQHAGSISIAFRQFHPREAIYNMKIILRVPINIL